MRSRWETHLTSCFIQVYFVVPSVCSQPRGAHSSSQRVGVYYHICVYPRASAAQNLALRASMSLV